jgi:protein pelota
MRIKSNINELVPGCSGKAILICDNLEDLWHLYNLVVKGDFVKTITFRKVTHEKAGKSSSIKKKINITIKVEEIEYDQKEGIIRYKGKNVSENEYIAIGQYQSIEIAKGLMFTIFKKNWDEISIDRLKQATDLTITSDLAAIVMEEGVAHLYLISSHITTLKAKIEQTIAKKRKGPSQHDKSLNLFFQKILDAIIKNINFEVVKCMIVASPGFTKDQFADYLSDNTANNKNYEIIQKNLKKFVYVHSSSGYKQALQEVMSKPEVLSQIKNTKASEDINVMERFNEILGKEMDRIIFGLNSVKIANEKEAVDTLMVSDNFLRKISPRTRQELSEIMKKVKSKGGSVMKMSSQHVTGEKIDAFGGITAILTYAMPELNESEVVPLEDIKEDHHHEEIEEDDQMAMSVLNDMGMFGMDEDIKNPSGNIEPKNVNNNQGNNEDEEEDSIHEEEDDEEEDHSLGNSSGVVAGKNKNDSIQTKYKGKPTKSVKKEREIQRKIQMRKKSNLDDDENN